ncbi:hypothetical protein D3C85_1642120 [compost metagenome]
MGSQEILLGEPLQLLLHFAFRYPVTQILQLRQHLCQCQILLMCMIQHMDSYEQVLYIGAHSPLLPARSLRYL